MEELIDILDENGIKIGKIATRKQVHDKGLWHKIVVVAIIDKNGRILMQQRSNSVEQNAGKWDVSVAGHVSSGQSSIEAAVREIAEEIGININKNDLEYIFTYKKSELKENYIDNQYFDFYIVNRNKIEIEDIVVQKSEVQMVKLCNLEDIKKILQEKEIVERPEVYKKLFKYLGE